MLHDKVNLLVDLDCSLQGLFGNFQLRRVPTAVHAIREFADNVVC